MKKNLFEFNYNKITNHSRTRFMTPIKWLHNINTILEILHRMGKILNCNKKVCNKIKSRIQ